MRIIVNDANILIDLVELGLLPHFFDLSLEFLTTSLILDELFEEQQEVLQPFIDQNKLKVEEFSPEDLLEIAILQQTKAKLSEQDCSAFYQAKKRKATLVTSDNLLRKFAKNNSLDVHGHLWVFDLMVTQETISPAQASLKLRELIEKVNPRLKLPSKECEKRFQDWGKK